MIALENLQTVYGVTSEVIMDNGRPHVLLRDAIRMDDEGLEDE